MRWPGKERKLRRESMGGASHRMLLLTSVLIVSQLMKVIFPPGRVFRACRQASNPVGTKQIGIVH